VEWILSEQLGTGKGLRIAMSASINIPKLGWTMEEGTLTEWLVEEGSTVNEGDPLYILETDKVDNEVVAPAAGVLRRRGVAGEVYPVGTEIGTIE
jgi:pyruvate/2-oxoglutarate dehydrogenase complex dihydrolipoamide acyltransferase (E2) component